MSKDFTVYVNLPEEGSPTPRPTQAINLGNGKFKLLPTADYNPKDEVWEFEPGSTVLCEERMDKDGKYLYAYAKA